MFSAIFDLMLGTVGRFVGQLYATYHIYINFVVMIYGFSILWAHNNLRTIMQRMEKGIIHFSEVEKNRNDYADIQKNFAKKWKEKNLGTRYFIPTHNDLWFEKVEGSELVDLLKISPDYVKMVLHKTRGEPKEDDFPPHVFKAWSDYRHGLITGMSRKFIDPKVIKEKLKQKNKK
jgi:hypothetical protein